MTLIDVPPPTRAALDAFVARFPAEGYGIRLALDYRDTMLDYLRRTRG